MQYVTINESLSDCVLPSIPHQYAYKCFPVRKFRGVNALDGGAWVVEHYNEQVRQIKVNHLRHQKRLLAKSEEKKKEFTHKYLVSHCHCQHPSDLCSINISSEDLYVSEKENFKVFSNVAYIEASDNNLNVEQFRSFENLEELQLQLNKISCVHVTHEDFLALRKLDLSYNNLKEAALLEIGKLRNLKKLSVRGCGFKFLPPEMSRGYLIDQSDCEGVKVRSLKKTRFPSLTHLDLAQNKLTDISTFASIAGLRRLVDLNLSENLISSVPHLCVMVVQRHFSSSTCATATLPRIQGSPNVLHETNNSQQEIEYSLKQKPQVSENCVNGKKEDEKPVHSIERSSVEAIDSIPNIGDDKESLHSHQNVEYIKVGKYAHPLQNVVENKSESGKFEIGNEVYNTAGETIGLNEGSVPKESNYELLADVDAVLQNTSSDVSASMSDVIDVMNVDFRRELNFSIDMTDLENDDDNLNLQTSRVTEEKVNNEEQDMALDDEVRRPFLSLVSLDLSCNQIALEESLLSLTAWPALQQVKIWENPILNFHRSVPSMLYHHLQLLCGVAIICKNPEKKEKDKVRKTRPSNKSLRRVKTDLPPIRRNNLMAIEAQIQKAVNDAESNAQQAVSHSQSYDESKGETKSVEHMNKMKSVEKDADNGQTFFITQTDETYVEPSIEDIEIESLRSKSPEPIEETLAVDELLRLDESVLDDVNIPETLQGSVLALKYMLEHPLQLNRGGYANNFAKAEDLPTSKKKKKEKSSWGRRVEKSGSANILDNALTNIKHQNNSHKDGLSKVLKEYERNEDIRKMYPDVKNMVKRVEKKYNKVRQESLQPIFHAQTDMHSLRTRVDNQSQQLSRLKHHRIGDLSSTGSRSITPRSRLRDRVWGKNIEAA